MAPPPEVKELVSVSVWDSACVNSGASICFLAFLPNILDSKASGRYVCTHTRTTWTHMDTHTQTLHVASYMCSWTHTHTRARAHTHTHTHTDTDVRTAPPRTAQDSLHCMNVLARYPLFMCVCVSSSCACVCHRNAELAMLQSVAERFKSRPYAWLWSQGAAQGELENSLNVGGFGEQRHTHTHTLTHTGTHTHTHMRSNAVASGLV